MRRFFVQDTILIDDIVLAPDRSFAVVVRTIGRIMDGARMGPDENWRPDELWLVQMRAGRRH